MSARSFRGALVWVSLFLALCGGRGFAQTPDPDPNASIRIPYGLSDGVPVQRVHVHLVNAPTDRAAAEKLKASLIEAFGVWAGDPFSFILADGGLERIREDKAVASAEYRLYQSTQPGEIIVALIVKLREAGEGLPVESPPPAPGASPSPLAEGSPSPEVVASPETSPSPEVAPSPKMAPSPVPSPSPTPRSPRGLLVNGRGFPTVFENDDSKLQFIVNGALGAFSDNDAWFGYANQFVAPPYNPQNRLTWTEAQLELGAGGVARLGKSPVWAYGAGTYLWSQTATADSFYPKGRLYGEVEKAYGGVLVAQKGSPLSFNISGGRQTFQLNRNYLFGYVRGSANALQRGGTYLSSRIAYEETVLARLRLGPLSLQGFYLQPDDLPQRDTNTRYLGFNFAYNNNKGTEVSVAYATAPDSTVQYALPGGQTQTRAGMWLVNPRVRFTDPLGLRGLWVESEYVHQGNRNFPMSAYATYAWLGYNQPDTPQKFGGGYRWAIFSGDNPATQTYERFDPLQSGGLGTWLQGISMAKVFPNTNLCSHNVNFNFRPRPNLKLSLDWFYLYSDQLNNLGGARPLQQLTSRRLGQEVMFTWEHSLNPNLFLLGVASVAMPGAALQNALGNPSPWTTLNLSLFLNL